MYYKNLLTRFLFRKNLFLRIKMRLSHESRKLTKNEFDDLAFLYQILNKEPDVIFDCGANIGFVSYQFYKRFTASMLYSFEPNPDVYQQLVKNLNLEERRIRKYNLGIGIEPGILEFFKNNNTGTSSFLKPNDFHMAHMSRRYEKIDVPVVSIDSFCNEHHIHRIAILKLDIEGYELQALKGSARLLGEGLIDFVFAEVNMVPSYEGQPLIEDVIAYLRSVNFIPYNIYGSYETPMRESVITNILFMSGQVAKEINWIKGDHSVFFHG
jgi:FkbM family methyltransferase